MKTPYLNPRIFNTTFGDAIFGHIKPKALYDHRKIRIKNKGADLIPRATSFWTRDYIGMAPPGHPAEGDIIFSKFKYPSNGLILSESYKSLIKSEELGSMRIPKSRPFKLLIAGFNNSHDLGMIPVPFPLEKFFDYQSFVKTVEVRDFILVYLNLKINTIGGIPMLSPVAFIATEDYEYYTNDIECNCKLSISFTS